MVSKTGDSRFESWLPRSLLLAWGAAIPLDRQVCGSSRGTEENGLAPGEVDERIRGNAVIAGEQLVVPQRRAHVLIPSHCPHPVSRQPHHWAGIANPCEHGPRILDDAIGIYIDVDRRLHRPAPVCTRSDVSST